MQRADTHSDGLRHGSLWFGAGVVVLYVSVYPPCAICFMHLRLLYDFREDGLYILSFVSHYDSRGVRSHWGKMEL
jgi:hypothetical protein